MSDEDEDSAPGAGRWVRSVSGKWIPVDAATAEGLMAQQKALTISQETSDKLADAIDDAIALRQQAETDKQSEQLRTDLASELKEGHPTARLAEFLKAIAGRGKPQENDE